MLSCLIYFAHTTSLQNRYVMCQMSTWTRNPGATAGHAYTSDLVYERRVVPENLQCHHLIIVPALPNFGLWGDVLCTVSLFHNSLKLI